MTRYFAQINKEELKNKIEIAISKLPKYPQGEDPPHNLPTLTPQIQKDLSKCTFDIENFFGYFEDDYVSWSSVKDLLGYRTLDNGFTFLGLLAGGDWEMPVFFLIYFDGSQLRVYLPKEGNPYNYATKQAFGNDEELDQIALKKQYPELFQDMELHEIDCADPRLQQDKKLILEDILGRIKEKK